MSLGARCSMYYSQNFTAKKSKTRTEPYLSLMTLYPRVYNKNNAKDPTRFHFSLRLSYNQSLEPKKSWYLGLGWVLKKPKIQTQIQTQKPKKPKTQTQTQTQISNFLGLNK